MTYRLNYELDSTSLVFDLGGYQGSWTSSIFTMYCCTIHIFEPVPEFAEEIERKFSRNEKIYVHNFGLADESRSVRINLNNDSSSSYKWGNDSRTVHLLKAVDFMEENRINKIDLMKINIEGAEYDLLDHLIDVGFVTNIVNLQVQFHDFVPNAEKRMSAIQKHLRKTHHLTYHYPFVWENWKLGAM